MTTVSTFQGIQFTEKMLADESLSDLLKTYNKIAAANGEAEVKKFSDKKSAVRRVWALLQKYGKATKKAAKEPTERRVRVKRFNYVAVGQPKASREDAPDAPVLRNMLLKGLLSKDGLSFNQAVDVVKDFDARCKQLKKPVRNNGKTIETRAYEGLRLIHYYLNYSMKQDGEGDDAPIKIVGNRRS